MGGSKLAEFPVLIKSYIPFEIEIFGVRNVLCTIKFEKNYVALKFNKERYFMTTFNYEYNYHLINIRFLSDFLIIYDENELSLIPENLKIVKSAVKNIEINKKYEICKLTGKVLLLTH